MGIFDKFFPAVAGALAGFATGGPAGAALGGFTALATSGRSRTRVGGAATRGISLAGESIAQTARRELQTVRGGGRGRLLPSRTQQAVRAVAVGECPRAKNVVTTQIWSEAPDGTMTLLGELDGRPYLMNSEIASLKKTVRQIRRAEQRVPRRGATGTKLKIDKAELEGVIRGMIASGSCPPRLLNIDNS